jgi:hypothetical protein
MTMAKKSPVELAKAFLKDLESEGNEVYREAVISDYGDDMGTKLVVHGKENAEINEDDVVAYVDHWQKKESLDLKASSVKKVAEEVLHYAKDKP